MVVALNQWFLNSTLSPWCMLILVLTTAITCYFVSRGIICPLKAHYFKKSQEE
uniref:Uncharacterized protein n=1 Tax=Anguilla anguilla TaxID=7936 RepID=A0A0E9VER3_ANGAN